MVKSLERRSDGTWRPSLGAWIERTIEEAKEIAALSGVTVIFDFNGIQVSIDSKSNVELARRDYYRAIGGCIPKAIGPEFKAELSDEELAHDEKICPDEDTLMYHKRHDCVTVMQDDVEGRLSRIAKGDILIFDKIDEPTGIRVAQYMSAEDFEIVAGNNGYIKAADSVADMTQEVSKLCRLLANGEDPKKLGVDLEDVMDLIATALDVAKKGNEHGN